MFFRFLCDIPTKIRKYAIRDITSSLINVKEKKIGRKEIGSPKNTHQIIRKAGRASLNASLTIETALVLPLFLSVMLGMILLTASIGQAGGIKQEMQKTAKQKAIYAYISKPEKEEIDIVKSYSIQKIPAISGLNLKVSQRVYARAWTGKDFRQELKEKGDKDENRKVYVTEHGKVYHTSLNCTHLRLSIRQISFQAAEAKRNLSGGKYYACSCCESGNLTQVYITDHGNRYHAKLSCSGLKRTIKEMKFSEAKHLPKCSKCGG